MNITYLTWGETPRSYGIFASQAVGQFVHTSQQFPEHSYSFLSGLPVIHSGLVREKLGYCTEIRNIRTKLGEIPFSIIPIITTQNFINSGGVGFRSMHGTSLRSLAKKLKSLRSDVIHCRAYHATWAALEVRHRYKLNYRVIFDARGLWPEEVAIKKGYDPQHPTYLFMKKVEQRLLKESDVTIVVSNPLISHYQKLGATQIECIHVSAPVEKLARNRVNLRPSADRLTVGYVGALATNTWHQPLELLRIYKKIRTEYPNSHLRIVTTSNHDEVRRIFLEIPSSEITITSTHNSDELATELEQFDIGILAYYRPETEIEKLLSRMVIAVKTAEYMAAGIPVLCNKMCGGAASVIEATDFGLTYDPEGMSEVTQNALSNLKNGIDREQIKKYASDAFSYQNNAKRYAQLYEGLRVLSKD